MRKNKQKVKLKYIQSKLPEKEKQPKIDKAFDLLFEETLIKSKK